MIHPHEVVVHKFRNTVDDYEKAVDSFLKKDWTEHEQRVINLMPDARGRDTTHPVVYEVVKRYRAAGWKCRSYGFTCIQFEAPPMADQAKQSSAGKKRWWVW